MDNITRKNNIVFDEVADIKSEIWSKTKSKIKKLFLQHLKMDPKHVKIERGHRIGKYDPTGQPRSVLVELVKGQTRNHGEQSPSRVQTSVSMKISLTKFA